MDALLGKDLSVVPNMAAHDALALDLNMKTRVNRRPRPGQPETVADIAVLEGRQNLAQALLLRLLTPRGSLKALGHENYGSRLHELIGRRKTEELRNLCRAFVLDAVAQEPRVEPIAVGLQFELDQERFDNFVFTLAVAPVSSGDPVALSLEVAL
jgi:phage baseplate assembly protein W